jgi:hypothetical protein
MLVVALIPGAVLVAGTVIVRQEEAALNQSKKVLDSPQALKRARDERPRRARFAALILLAAALALALTFALRPPQRAEEADSSIVLFSRDKTLLDTISVARSGADAYTLVNLND